MISIVLLTYDRLHLLRQCVERVLANTSEDTTEIVVWDNGSTDGTAEYLDSLTDERLKIVHAEKNLGMNAYRPAFSLTTQPYLIDLDDDIIDAPPGWDRRLREAYDRLPMVGYLAAAPRNDGKSRAAELYYVEDADKYRQELVDGVDVRWGPTGGWCTITDRELYERVGGFGTDRRRTFFHEDGRYIANIERLGLKSAVLGDLEVFHASGPAYSAENDAKMEFYRWRSRRRARRTRLKRAVLRVPLVAPLNRRFGWFHPPEPASSPRVSPPPS